MDSSIMYLSPSLQNLEKTVTALPWLEEKRRVVEAEKQEQESQSRFGMPEPGNWTFKPYQSGIYQHFNIGFSFT